MDEHPHTFSGARESIVDACNYELNWQRDRILHCLNQLNDDDVWWRPVSRDGKHASLNRIGDLIRHLCGNLNQWTQFGLGGDERFSARKRDLEFQEKEAYSRKELINLIDRSISDALDTITSASDSDWSRVRFVQTRNVTGFGAVLQTSMHLYGHTQEIICLTRQILGNDYKPHQSYGSDGSLKSS